MKLSQLMLAGDYLTYKGDWVTNTAYNVNDCVTWAHDGHLYEVIKAHTSSATLDPDNPEYYKAMTASKYVKYTYNLTDPIGRTKIIALGEKVRAGKNIYAIITDGALFYYPTFSNPPQAIRFGTSHFNAATDTLSIISLEVNQNIARQSTFKIDINGTITTVFSNYDGGQTIDIFVEA